MHFFLSSFGRRLEPGKLRHGVPTAPKQRLTHPCPPITRNPPRVPILRCNCSKLAGFSLRKPCQSGNPGQERSFFKNSWKKQPKQAGREVAKQWNRSPLRARIGHFGRKRGMRPLGIEKRALPGCLGGDAAITCHIHNPRKRPLFNGALKRPGCTSFASPPVYAEAIIRVIAVILPEQIALLLREKER